MSYVYFKNPAYIVIFSAQLYNTHMGYICLRKQLAKDFFYEREKKNGSYISNNCGRDFLYFSLAYYFPELFNNISCNPLEIDRRHTFGIPVSPRFAWTQIQFLYIANLLHKHDLSLTINQRRIWSFFNFVCAILFSKMSYDKAMESIKYYIDNDTACGIDISLGQFGLLDHVMFVYGYDDEGLLVVDSHTVEGLEYTKIDGEEYMFKLPYEIIRKRWTRFGRVWGVGSIV